jgi:hypothetical protein
MRAHEQAGPSDKRWMWMGGWAEEIWVRIKRGYMGIKRGSYIRSAF